MSVLIVRICKDIVNLAKKYEWFIEFDLEILKIEDYIWVEDGNSIIIDASGMKMFINKEKDTTYTKDELVELLREMLEGTVIGADKERIDIINVGEDV